MNTDMWTYVQNFVVCVFVLSVVSAVGSSALCSSVYGSTEPCSFVPAPPGRTPPCARPGDTFCEHVEHYPMQHIRYLIDKWGYDYSTLFNDESTADFSSYFSPPDYQYGGYPNSLPTSSGYSYPEPIFIPKPPARTQYQPPGKQYIPPPSGNRANYSEFQGYPERRPQRFQPYQNGIGGYNRGHHHGFPGPGYGYQGNQGPYYDPHSWWRYTRESRNNYIRSKRSSSPEPSTPNPTPTPQSSNSSAPSNSSSTEPKTRSKRQVLGGPQTLCPTRSQYITPQAALNNKGNWMYVVNLQEQDNRYTQLVKSETCVSQTCSGLCSVPTGYTARCEQRYVQKRLVALEGAGQNLYTDVFWFPSCCVCTFTNG